MKTEPAMPIELGPFLADTLGLSNAEVGSYVLLIIAYWANAGPLPNDDKSLQMTARCPDAEWARTKGLLQHKFHVANGCWQHSRIDDEIAKSKQRKLTMTQLSVLGVEARRQTGQLPPATAGQPSGQPKGSPTVERISKEKELDRVEKRLAEVRAAGTTTAQGTTFTVSQKAELRALKDRREELKQSLGFMA